MKKTLLPFVLCLLFESSFAQTSTLDSIIKLRSTANLTYISLYKENSEMSYTSPFGEIGAPAKYVINGKLTTAYMVLAPANMPVAFSINPDFTVRVRTERSAGVRTPSFRLGGSFYVRMATAVEHYRYTQVSFTHHSNGQDGAAKLPDGTINTKTGNFNTNYLTVAYRFGNFTRPKLSSGPYYSYHHHIGLEWHKWFKYETALAGDYGFTRLNYDFSFRVYQQYHKSRGAWRRGNTVYLKEGNTLEKESWRFNVQLSYAVNAYQKETFFAPKRRMNIETAAHYSLPFMQNVFLMASFGYYGEDPYNIYFKDRYAFMRFGLSSTFSRYRLK